MMAGDPALNTLVLEGLDGGQQGNTYTWTGSDWVAPAAAACPGKTFCRAQAGLAFDPAGGRLILAAGGAQSPTNQTDAWDGHSWSEVKTPTPVSPEVSSAVSDAARGVVVAITCSGETWILVGDNWTMAHPLHRPGSMLQGCALAYDPRDKVDVLVGVPETDHAVTVMWVWDGQDWRQIPTT
ncbi:MAG TPA: hypothetical protein VGQ42_01325 [Candidatus Dormibacteraeota bacterium]|jgi:hypothetical protein|nr:hypothetical protein [Candidatus Dormibacteraeota bacterium]